MKRISLFSSLILCGSAAAADGSLVDVQESGDFDGLFQNYDGFGAGVASIGDFNGDGIGDLVVGEPYDDQAGAQKGAVWLVYLNADGTIGGYDKILNPTAGARFGASVACLGDVDGDGVVDVAAGSFWDNSVYVLLLNSDGTLKSHSTIDGLAYATGNNPLFGYGLVGIDFDGDGRRELVVGSSESASPEVFVFTLNTEGGVVAHHSISEGTGGFTDILTPTSDFGYAVGSAGDVDGDGTEDLAVTDPNDQDGGIRAGAVWILFMNPDGTVRDHQKISPTQGGFTAPLLAGQEFGTSVTSLGDFDGGGAPDLMVTSYLIGTVWLLFLNEDGTVRSYLSYDTADAGASQYFGRTVTTVDDLNGDGMDEIVVGDSDFAGGGAGRGAIYVLFPPEIVRGARSAYGCDLNPEDSLVPTSAPAIGTTMTFEVNNPLDTQNHGTTFPVLVASLASAGQCGLALDGWHMDPNEPTGELLVLPIFEASVLGEAWNGPSQPVTVGLDIPQDPCLVGIIGYVQAAMVDFADDTQVPIGLTRAWELRLGT